MKNTAKTEEAKISEGIAHMRKIFIEYCKTELGIASGFTLSNDGENFKDHGIQNLWASYKEGVREAVRRMNAMPIRVGTPNTITLNLYGADGVSRGTGTIASPDPQQEMSYMLAMLEFNRATDRGVTIEETKLGSMLVKSFKEVTTLQNNVTKVTFAKVGEGELRCDRSYSLPTGAPVTVLRDESGGLVVLPTSQLSGMTILSEPLKLN